MKPEYADTRFHFLPKGKPAAFWVITAWNPKGMDADEGDNIGADNALRQLLAKRKLLHFRVIGTSSDEQHAEPGWGVVCEEATAIALGNAFKQEAVFRFTSREITLVPCRGTQRVVLGKPRDRILDPRDMRLFTLYVGSPNNRARLGAQEYFGICVRVGAQFPGFTTQRADGCFNSLFEDTLLIHVATREARKVLAVAHELRVFLNQQGVGILHNGIYQRVRSWTDDGMILESFGLTAGPTKI